MNMKKEPDNEPSFTQPDGDLNGDGAENKASNKLWEPKVLAEAKLRMRIRKERKTSDKHEQHEQELIEAIELIRDEIDKEK